MHSLMIARAANKATHIAISLIIEPSATSKRMKDYIAKLLRGFIIAEIFRDLCPVNYIERMVWIAPHFNLKCEIAEMENTLASHVIPPMVP
jgi:hypothetical protein